MKKPEIARAMARRAKESKAAAADRLDQVVHEIVTNVRKGNISSLPGLGVFSPDQDGKLCFKPESAAPKKLSAAPKKSDV